eukprot:TRINITY_DN23895_c0_g1_i2.p1 TRINITY_DN23895_c0_g1~~TRINITY_DN23895_c0_g1_i2.p1  ORF type:complete len:328 (-),score=22.78 TRINITY_DN23895_c0_g1_i2:201-1184(-)
MEHRPPLMVILTNSLTGASGALRLCCMPQASARRPRKAGSEKTTVLAKYCVLCVFLLAVATSQFLHSAAVLPIPQLLAVFRPRSKVTKGFGAEDKHSDLAIEELCSALCAESGSDWQVSRLSRNRTSQVQTLDINCHGETTTAREYEALLRKAGARCVLLHGLYQVLGESADEKEALSAASAGVAAVYDHSRAASWSLDPLVCGLDQHLSKEARLKYIADALEALSEELPSGERVGWKQSQFPVVLLRDLSCHGAPFRLIRRIVSGGAVGEEVNFLPTGRSPREARGGFLKTYAVCRRPQRTGVSMTPELAFLAANLARVLRCKRPL